MGVEREYIKGVGEVTTTVTDDEEGVRHVDVVLPATIPLGVAFERARDELGPNHPDTLRAGHRYAVAIGELPDRRSDAIDLLEWLARARTGDPENRLLTLNDLSRLLRVHGRSARAEQVLRDARTGWERLRGPDDPMTLSSAHNLASILVGLGRREEAERLGRDTVARRTRILGAKHPDTIVSRNTLAGTLRGSPARLAEAESMYRSVLADLGDDSADLADVARHNLAAVLNHQGKLAESAETFRALLVTRERKLGPDHLDVLTIRSSLAAVLNNLGQVREAEARLVAVLADSKRALGPQHPHALNTMVSLAAILSNQDRDASALPLLKEAVEGYRIAFGPDHRRIRELTDLYVQLGGDPRRLR